MRDAVKAGRLEADWTAELDALGMIWDKHDAAWRSRLAAAADYHRMHGHLAAPTTPVGAWLAEQRHLATRHEPDTARADALTALAPDWRLPHGADWHRKYHLLRAHLATGADPATLTSASPMATAPCSSSKTPFPKSEGPNCTMPSRKSRSQSRTTRSNTPG